MRMTNRTPWTRGLRRHAVMLIATLYVLSMVVMPSSPVVAQTTTEEPQTPDVVIPGTGEGNTGSTPQAAVPTQAPAKTSNASAQAEPTTTTPSAGLSLNPTDPGFPAVIAHGLAYLNGQQAVWQVREVAPPSVNAANSETGSAALVYQVEGSSIIRNDVTGKRALLDPGEAYFRAAGDAYTIMSAGSGSKVWMFDVVATNDVSEDSFYESPMIDSYSEGVLDMVMVRYVLKAGESVDIPTGTGPGLIMSTGGDIDVESGGLGLLATGDGQLITEAGKVTNNSNATAQYVFVGFGASVSDDSAQSGSPYDATAVPSTSGDATSTSNDSSTTETTTATDSTDSNVTPASGQTTINITAQAEIYVVVVADGTTVFDGPIPKGGQSGAIAGTDFKVYTSSGVNTVFTNACGSEFQMGYEEGEATYTLTAEPC